MEVDKLTTAELFTAGTIITKVAEEIGKLIQTKIQKNQ